MEIIYSGSPTTISRWRVRRGQIVTTSTVLCTLSEVDAKGEERRVTSNHSGRISVLLKKEGDSIKESDILARVDFCRHDVVIKDLCAECGVNLRTDDGLPGERKESATASVAMVHNIPELYVSEEKANELADEDTSRLLNNRKLVLLIDLDQTLIHTTCDDVPLFLKDVHHFQLPPGGQGAPFYHTKLRPGTTQFLEKMSELYELHIVTFGNRLYAHTIARLIDPETKFFGHRILSRDEAFNPLTKTANLKSLFPRGDSMVCIIDDRAEVWSFSKHLVHVKPYKYFRDTDDINLPGQENGHRHRSSHDSRPHKSSKLHAKERHRHERRRRGDDKRIDNNGNHKPSGKEVVSDAKVAGDKGLKEKDDGKFLSTETKEKVEKKPEPTLPEIGGKIEFEKDQRPEHMKASEITVDGAGDCTKEVSRNTEKDPSGDTEKDKSESTPDRQLGDTTKIPSEVTEGCPSVDGDHGRSEKSEKGTVNEGKSTSLSAVDEENWKDAINISEEELELARLKPEDDPWLDRDNYLSHLSDILRRIHEAFYAAFDARTTDELPDLKEIIPKLRARTLGETRLVFSGVVPLGHNVEHSGAFHMARHLGAEVQNELQTHGAHRTNYVIASRGGTRKVSAAKRAKIRVVSPHWLWETYYQWRRLSGRQFRLERDYDPDTFDFNDRKRPLPPAEDALPKKKLVKNEESFATSSGSSSVPHPSLDFLRNPLMQISPKETMDMEDEVEAAMEDEDEDEAEMTSDEEEEEYAAGQSSLVVDQDSTTESSDQDSLSGAEYPKGWRPQRGSCGRSVSSEEEDREYRTCPEGYDYEDAEYTRKILRDDLSSSEGEQGASGGELTDEEECMDALRAFI